MVGVDTFPDRLATDVEYDAYPASRGQRKGQDKLSGPFLMKVNAVKVPSNIINAVAGSGAASDAADIGKV